MNEKLEQQFNDYYYHNYAYITSQADTKEIVKSIAQHFYNLALADVREQTIRLNNINKQIAKEKKEGASKWQEGVSAGYAEIISFIDNLTK